MAQAHSSIRTVARDASTATTKALASSTKTTTGEPRKAIPLGRLPGGVSRDSAGVFYPAKRTKAASDPVVKIRGGYPYAEIAGLAKALDMTVDGTIRLLGLPRSTILKKQSDARPLPVAISDHLYRVNRVLARCLDLFEQQKEAVYWLQHEHPSFKGATALSLLDTTAGYERVLDELERIDLGIPA